MTNTPSPEELSELTGLLARNPDLAALLGGTASTPCIITAGEYAREQLASLGQARPGTAGTYRSGLRLLCDGAHDLCQCDCAACDGPQGCPCACGCEVDGAGEHHESCTGRGNLCAARWTGRGATPVDRIRFNDLEQGQFWARCKAARRARRRNRLREDAGRAMLDDDGKGGAENFVAGTRWLFSRAVDDELVARNHALRLKKPRRKDREPRALAPGEFSQVLATATSTGQDPAGDGLILGFALEAGPRRGGVISARFGDVDTTDATTQVREPKTDSVHTVPITPELAEALVAHALERGPRMAAPAGASDAERRAGVPVVAQSDPLLYRPPADIFDEDGYFVHRTVRPVTVKSLESMRDRIRRHLPWADRTGFRLHDLRHTIGTMIERIAGHAVASRHLGHRSGGDTTSTYVVASLAENAAAIAVIFRCEHPLAPDDRA